jgi:hypothetical protein
MAGKPEMVRALEGLPQDSLKKVKQFFDSLNRQETFDASQCRDGGQKSRFLPSKSGRAGR